MSDFEADLKEADLRAELADLRSRLAAAEARIAELEADQRKPWAYRIVAAPQYDKSNAKGWPDIHEVYEATVEDIGHSERVILLTSAELDQRLKTAEAPAPTPATNTDYLCVFCGAVLPQSESCKCGKKKGTYCPPVVLTPADRLAEAAQKMVEEVCGSPDCKDPICKELRDAIAAYRAKEGR